MEADQGEEMVMVKVEADQSGAMAKVEADQGDVTVTVEADPGEAMVKVDVHQAVDNKRERGLEEEEETLGCSNWIYIAFCVVLCAFFFTPGNYKDKNYVDNFDSFLYIYLSILLFNGAFACFGWGFATVNLKGQSKYHIPRNHDFRAYTLYLPYYLSTVLIMIMLADIQAGLYFCGGLSLMLVLYGFELSIVVLPRPLAMMYHGRFYTSKFMKFVYGSVFVAVLTFMLMRWATLKH